MIYDLPTSVEVCGVEYEIRSDYRAVLDICIALSDPELTNKEKAYVALWIFYPAVEGYKDENGAEVIMPPQHYEEALQRCYWFIDCGNDEEDKTNSPRLVDWEGDFQYIVSPINRVMGGEIRSIKYLHWWTFIAAYMEIGECLFSQIVNIRSKLTRHKTLDKTEREWYRRNRKLVDITTKFTASEKSVIEQWGGG